MRKVSYCSVLATLVALTACGEPTWRLRECRTTDGSMFTYMQSSHDPVAEKYNTFARLNGVYDTEGWWRDEDVIVTCRDVKELS